MKPELGSLLRKARESLEAARLLKGAGYGNIAVSRSYYAMFHAAEALLLEQGLAFSSHSAVIAAFGKQFARKRVLDPKLHRRLIDAQDLRNLADYGIGPSLTADQVQEVLAWAAEFLAEAERLLARE
jgi:uncharacterized protein (UPF0332 family)